jgi:hypothetical protein
VETNQVAETKPKMSRLCNIWFGGDEWEGIILTLTVPPHVSVISHFPCHLRSVHPDPGLGLISQMKQF